MEEKTLREKLESAKTKDEILKALDEVGNEIIEYYDYQVYETEENKYKSVKDCVEPVFKMINPKGKLYSEEIHKQALNVIELFGLAHDIHGNILSKNDVKRLIRSLEYDDPDIRTKAINALSYFAKTDMDWKNIFGRKKSKYNETIKRVEEKLKKI